MRPLIAFHRSPHLHIEGDAADRITIVELGRHHSLYNERVDRRVTNKLNEHETHTKLDTSYNLNQQNATFIVVYNNFFSSSSSSGNGLIESEFPDINRGYLLFLR